MGEVRHAHDSCDDIHGRRLHRRRVNRHAGRLRDFRRPCSHRNHMREFVAPGRALDLFGFRNRRRDGWRNRRKRGHRENERREVAHVLEEAAEFG